jgi:hypothetical protein
MVTSLYSGIVGFGLVIGRDIMEKLAPSLLCYKFVNTLFFLSKEGNYSLHHVSGLKGGILWVIL